MCLHGKYYTDLAKSSDPAILFYFSVSFKTLVCILLDFLDIFGQNSADPSQSSGDEGAPSFRMQAVWGWLVDGAGSQAVLCTTANGRKQCRNGNNLGSFHKKNDAGQMMKDA